MKRRGQQCPFLKGQKSTVEGTTESLLRGTTTLNINIISRRRYFKILFCFFIQEFKKNYKIIYRMAELIIIIKTSSNSYFDVIVKLVKDEFTMPTDASFGECGCTCKQFGKI